MRHTISERLATLGLGSLLLFSPLQINAAEPDEVKNRAERSFDQLKEQHHPQKSARPAEENPGAYPPDRYWIGNGQGDLAKGKVVCQRVSELSARTDLAKQIRVMVKEHMVDRVRERTGREPEQDIELTREELVQEYLQGVQIVDRRIDEEHKICSATAVMPKSPMPPKQTPDLNPAPPASR
ncbi:MAG: hypothetical protein IT389_05185 [Nitrospira sp.]|nr:hypothetical protein [Nitrospira sp.]